MKARGGLECEIILVGWQPPLQDYFERDLESDTVTCLMGQALLYDDSEKSGHEKDSSDRRYRRLAACPKCGNRWHPCPDQGDPSRRVRQKTGNISKNSLWTDHAQNKSFFRLITLPSGEGSWEEVIILRFYPNQTNSICESATPPWSIHMGL